MPGQRSYAAGSYSLELARKNVGVLTSVAGGDAFADVVAASPGKSFYAKKQVTNVHYDPFGLEVGFAMAKPLYDWISASLTGNPAPKGGAIVEADAKGMVRARREFSAAVVSAVTIPACDAAAKGAGYLKLELAPEHVSATKGSGKAAPPLAKQTPWVPSNFRLDIDGLDTKHVTKIDSFTITQSVAAPVRRGRDPAKQSSTLDFPNLKVTLAATSAQTWVDWFEDFVLAGSSSDANEKNGTLHFLAPSLKAELGQVRFFNLGIFKLGAEAAQPTATKRLVAQLYCERMELSIPP
jgi:hypothetical protein